MDIAFLPGIILRLLLLAVMAAVAVFALVLSLRILRFVLRILGRALVFLRNEVRDAVRLVAALCAGCILLPLFLLRSLAGNRAGARHYGRAMESELAVAGGCLSRMLFFHPAALLGLRDGGEAGRRVARALEREPGGEGVGGAGDALEGYVLEGTLPGGGSGARLYVARPGRERVEAWRRAGLPVPDRVVIKLFRLDDGSNLPQIVRESRALEAARDLGLVLEHGIDENRFYYVMPYVPGVDLGTLSQRLHAATGHRGLDEVRLREVLGYVADLLATLDRYHRHGLWHKDVKPENVIVAQGRAYLVDLGLVTPLRSGMTLTTHGTEYYRDPELVRAALRGAKVSEVDGVRFDLYGVGAVLYSLVEGSFPAHGSLSQVTRPCPEALRWVIRRAMADLSQRYGSAREMLADVEAIRTAPDLEALRPADLPSLRGGGEGIAAVSPEPPQASAERRAAPADTPRSEPAPPPMPSFAAAPTREAPTGLRRRRPLRVVTLLAGALVAVGLVQALLSVMPPARSSSHSSATLVVHSQGSRDPGPRTAWDALPALRLADFASELYTLAGLPPRRVPRALALVEDVSLQGPEARRQVEELCDRLAAQGFLVLGDPRREAEEEDLALLARLRRNYAALDLGDADAKARLQQAFSDDTRLLGILRLTSAGDRWTGRLLGLAGPDLEPVRQLLQAMAAPR